jgi:DNA-binding SARP family transcriptional activator
MAHNTESQLLAQYRQLSPHTRLIIMNPNYRAQHLILRELESPFTYTRFHGDRLSLDQAQPQLESTIAEHVQGNTIKARVIALDECDRIQDDALVTLVRDLLERAREARIVLLMRRLPMSILRDARLRHISQMIPIRDGALLHDYVQHQQTGALHLLEVRGLGNGHVVIDGKSITHWDGVLPRALFFFLIDRVMTTRNQIFETFWPNLSVKDATNVFHVTKRKISEVLGVDLTVYRSGFYHLSQQVQVLYDVSMFNHLIQDSLVADAETSTMLLEDAAEIYRGRYITSLDFDWVKQRRTEVEQNYADAMFNLGKLLEQKGSQERALNYYLRACALNHVREDIVLRAMQVCRQLNMPADGIVLYERLVGALAAVGLPEPSAAIQSLAREMRMR